MRSRLTRRMWDLYKGGECVQTLIGRGRATCRPRQRLQGPPLPAARKAGAGGEGREARRGRRTAVTAATAAMVDETGVGGGERGTERAPTAAARRRSGQSRPADHRPGGLHNTLLQQFTEHLFTQYLTFTQPYNTQSTTHNSYRWAA